MLHRQQLGESKKPKIKNHHQIHTFVTRCYLQKLLLYTDLMFEHARLKTLPYFCTKRLKQSLHRPTHLFKNLRVFLDKYLPAISSS